MLSPGNSKLGSIYSFSVPWRETCPGRTKACTAHCYAKRGFYTMPSTKRALKNKLRQAKRPGFVKAMIDEIREKRVRRLRIHASGDFLSVEYTRKWVAIVKSCPQTIFLAYTRSWRDPKILPALKVLAGLKNMRLWWSTDGDTAAEGRPPRVEGVRVAFMRRRPDEPIPDGTNLVFRTYRNTLEKFVDGKLVCPAEQGSKDKNGQKVHITCERCQLCLKRNPIPTKDAVLS